MSATIIKVNKGELRGNPIKGNVIDFCRVVDVLEGTYFQNEEQLIVALEDGRYGYIASTRHSYLLTRG